MKTLNIDSPVSHRAAEVALFEKIQDRFNLHPAEMVKRTKSLAREQGSPAGIVALEIYPKVQALFAELMTHVEVFLKYGQTVDRQTSSLEADMIEFFGLRPADLTKELIDGSKRHGYEPLDALIELRAQVSHVVLWAFDEVNRILEKEGGSN